MTVVLNRKDQIIPVQKTDARVKRIAGAISKAQRRPDALIELLHIIQDSFGYVPLDLMNFVAKELRVTPSKVYGVVTFYHFFSLKPKGEHNCLVCTGTACYVKGAQSVVDQLERAFGVKPGETTSDNKFGLQVARCLGACGLAPAVVFDSEILAKVNPDEIAETLKVRVGK